MDIFSKDDRKGGQSHIKIHACLSVRDSTWMSALHLHSMK